MAGSSLSSGYAWSCHHRFFFEKVLEAALITGIIAAATRGVAVRARWLTAGLLAGIAGSLGVASLTERIAQLAEGAGQELFSAFDLGIAVAMLAWHKIWMSRHGAQMAREARGVGLSVRSGDKALFALFLVVALAVLREGSETVLFLHGLLAGSDSGVGPVLSAGALCRSRAQRDPHSAGPDPAAYAENCHALTVRRFTAVRHAETRRDLWRRSLAVRRCQVPFGRHFVAVGGLRSSG